MINRLVLLICLCIALASGLPARKKILPGRALYPVSQNSGYGRIAGGQTADPYQFPYFVTMILNKDLLFYTCDGVILSETRVLTSGYCTEGFSSAEIRAGLPNEGGVPPIQVVTARDFIPHSRYEGDKFVNDIGMVNLTNEPLQFAQYVQPIPIAQEHANFGAVMTIIGSGFTGPDQHIGDGTIYYAEGLERVDEDEAIDIYPDYSFSDKLCIKDPDEEKAACNTDFGGPVVNEKGEVAGISLLFTAEACNSTLPQCYTEVSEHKDWILNNM